MPEETTTTESDTDTGTSTEQDDAEAQRLLAEAVAQSDKDSAAHKEQLTKLQADLDKWKSLARKHEGRARENAEAASKTKTVEEQLEEVRKTLAERDVADQHRNGRLAMVQVQHKLAEAGLTSEDVAGLLELIDASTLLKDGEPDDGAIEKLAKSLIKVGGRSTPDRDQGKRSQNAPQDMNSLIRRMAGISTK